MRREGLLSRIGPTNDVEFGQRVELQAGPQGERFLMNGQFVAHQFRESQLA